MRMGSTGPAPSIHGIQGVQPMSEAPVDPWLVLRTRSRHEAVVESVLPQKQIVAYLPRRKAARSAQGRCRSADVPLFPGYLFVRPRSDQYAGMRYIRGSCGLVMAADRPAVLPERDVQAVRTLLDSEADFRIEPELVAGQRVKV